MKICPACHHENDDQDRFCRHCGGPLNTDLPNIPDHPSTASNDQPPKPPVPHAAPQPKADENTKAPAMPLPAAPLPLKADLSEKTEQPEQAAQDATHSAPRKNGKLIAVLALGILLGAGVVAIGSSGLFSFKADKEKTSEVTKSSADSKKDESKEDSKKEESKAAEKEKKTSEAPKTDITTNKESLPDYAGLTVYKANHNLHVRSEPSTSSDSIGSISQGGQAVIDGIAYNGNQTWGHLDDADGWVCIYDGSLELLTPISEQNAPAVEIYPSQDLINYMAQYNMKLRSAPSLSASQVGSVTKGEQVIVDDYVQDGVRTWGHVYGTDVYICISDDENIYLR